MIDAAALLADAKSLASTLVADLRGRTEDVDEVKHVVRGEFDRARAAERTGRTYVEWREDVLNQAAAAWVLAAVFVRFCEDNRLTDPPLLSGPGQRRRVAQDHRSGFLAEHRTAGDREWLEQVFGRYRECDATAELFGARNPLWLVGPSADGARAILDLFWALEPDGGLVHDFTDPRLDTRFLGDLYQDLSEHAKKTYALLQTPDFVESFILDYTLDPAIAEFGLGEVRMIDPACGSGHFLLGAFGRLFDRWRDREPATSPRALAQRALDAVHGVDVNPFAVAVARFRLVVAALRAAGIDRLEDAPAFGINLAVGDSLLHGSRPGHLLQLSEEGDRVLRHRYPTEDAEAANRLLAHGQYHAVVANPPYITVKDPALRDAYRARYDTCYMQYHLSAPFVERLFDLAVSPEDAGSAGFVGAIVDNAFMKRQYGQKLVEDFLPRIDLTHVVDTSGAYIPGHGTPTVIVFARNRDPSAESVRGVLGIRGEPGRPVDAGRGEVWTSIVDLIDVPDSENEYVSVDDVDRGRLSSHPWSLQGGAAPDLLAQIEDNGAVGLARKLSAVGRTTHTGEDEAYVLPANALQTHGLSSGTVSFAIGEDVRDYRVETTTHAIFPYSHSTAEARLPAAKEAVRHLWKHRTVLRTRLNYGQTNEERGLYWWEYTMFFRKRWLSPLSIAFAFVATHNHFVLDRGGKVFNRSAPVIKLPEGATEDEHLALLGLLNSSTACFWMKQVFHDKGVGGIGGGIGDEAWEPRYEIDSTKLKLFPIPEHAPLGRARELDRLATELSGWLPSAVLARRAPSAELLNAAREQVTALRARMVAWQEELDWECYRHYGLLDDDLTADDPPPLAKGERAFEIVLARRMAAGETTTTWFERHGSTPITELSAHWSDDYRRLVERRIELIESDRKLGLLERPEHKRRWNWDEWHELETGALETWLLDRLEDPALWPADDPRVTTTAQLTDQVGRDPAVRAAAQRLTGAVDADLAGLVTRLIEGQAVAYRAEDRHTTAGLRVRAEWEKVWKAQRREDAIDARTELPPDDPEHLGDEEARLAKKNEVGEITPPPKYTKPDFATAAVWSLRGKLDVPKERFVAYPRVRLGADSSPVVGWAGWDHLQQARALAGLYTRQRDDGAEPAALAPLLAGIDELVPWLKQWHNELDPVYGQRMGDYFATWLEQQTTTLGLTRAELTPWRPRENDDG